MNEIDFWTVVEKLNWDETGDDEAVVEPVVHHLSNSSDEDIFQFEEILSQKLYQLDTVHHAKEIGEGAYDDKSCYFSVDGFLYSRCVVVANGKSLFDSVLKEPREFPKDLEFEPILYVAHNAYERKNGKEWDFFPSVSYETFQNEEGWKT